MNSNKALSINEEAIFNLDALIRRKYQNINGLIIASNSNTLVNNVILEKYYNGFTERDSFHVASVTKSILSALIGNDGIFSFSAIGDGGNIICCIPDK